MSAVPCRGIPSVSGELLAYYLQVKISAPTTTALLVKRNSPPKLDQRLEPFQLAYFSPTTSVSSGVPISRKSKGTEMMNRTRNRSALQKLKRLRTKYAECAGGFRDQVYGLMAQGLRQIRTLEVDQFLLRKFLKEAGLKKRKYDTLALTHEAMAYIMNATSHGNRQIAWKRARVLDYLARHDTPAEGMAAAIKKGGGIEKLLKKISEEEPRRAKPKSVALTKIKNATPKASTPRRQVIDDDLDETEEAQENAAPNENDKYQLKMMQIRYSAVETLTNARRGSSINLVGSWTGPNGGTIKIEKVIVSS